MAWQLLSVITLTPSHFCTVAALKVTAESWPQNNRCVHVMQPCTQTARPWWRESFKCTQRCLCIMLGVPASTELNSQYFYMCSVSFLPSYSTASLLDSPPLTKLDHFSYWKKFADSPKFTKSFAEMGEGWYVTRPLTWSQWPAVSWPCFLFTWLRNLWSQEASVVHTM